MAYGSDFRIKLLMRDIQLAVTEKLKSEGIKNPLKLRIFDESDDDQKKWNEGGLTFVNKNQTVTGSNDAAWYKDEEWIDPITKEKSAATPVLVIEGSYGTETGNVGSAQKARFNHALGAAERECKAVYLLPKYSEYYKIDKTKNHPPPIWVSTASWMDDIVLACLQVTKDQRAKGGMYLMIDAYNRDQLFNLVYALVKNDPTIIEQITTEIIHDMDEYVKNKVLDFSSMSSQTVERIPLKNGTISSDFVGKILKHDERAFTTSKYRNGHIIWGEAEILHILTKKKVFLILPRLNALDCAELDKAKKKEWSAIRNSDHIVVITIDDMIFDSEYVHLTGNFNSLRGKPMSGEPLRLMNKYWKELKIGLLEGKIRINK